MVLPDGRRFKSMVRVHSFGPDEKPAYHFFYQPEQSA